MNIKQSSLHAKKINFVNHNLGNQSFQMKPIFLKKIIKKESNTYCIELTIEFLNTLENPFPFDLSIIFESEYVFSDESKEKDIMTFLNVNAIQMIFPFMRATINNVVTSALLPPLVLPLINVANFIEKQ